MRYVTQLHRKMTPIGKTNSLLEITNLPRAMHLSTQLSQVTLEELYGQVMFSNVVTRTDRQLLKAALLQESLSDNEHDIINRLIYNVRRGWVRIID